MDRIHIGGALKEVNEKLNKVFKWLSAIPVSGEAVDLMFAAKQELRAAYKILNESKKEDTDG